VTWHLRIVLGAFILYFFVIVTSTFASLELEAGPQLSNCFGRESSFLYGRVYSGASEFIENLAELDC
jgi:hypothetical protein